MAASLPVSAIVVSASLLLLLPLSFGKPSELTLTYHGGPLLSGSLDLALIWYGQFSRAEKQPVRSFIDSLNTYSSAANQQPQVSTWWRFIGSYHEATGNKSTHMKVKVVKQVVDASYSVGKVITSDFIAPLVQQATGGNPNIIPVVFTSKDVAVYGLCLGKCAAHGVLGNQPYIVVGQPEIECPEACAVPFHKPDVGTAGILVKPPNGNVGGDSMAIALAQGLVELVTNPFHTGFYQDMSRKPVEAANACQGIFARGAGNASPGKIRIDRANMVGFNAYGKKGRRFLVPAIWNPKTESCWTVM